MCCAILCNETAPDIIAWVTWKDLKWIDPEILCLNMSLVMVSEANFLKAQKKTDSHYCTNYFMDKHNPYEAYLTIQLANFTF